MRIDRLEIENFKCFEKLSFDLNPHFTLFVGENGSGKSSVLDALAVAASIWLFDPPDSTLSRSRRDYLPGDIRGFYQHRGDRLQFAEFTPVSVKATGLLGDLTLTWQRTPDEIEDIPKILSESQYALWIAVSHIQALYAIDRTGEMITFPILAGYHAGRVWSKVGKTVAPPANGPARRWAAFRDCLSGDVDLSELTVWFRREHGARANRGGRWRPGYQIVLRAVQSCFFEVDEIWFDDDRDEIVLSIDGNAQPFSNLSAGQRILMAMVADIAIKAVTQNAYLIPPDELGPEDDPIPRVLQQTPGIVLIDELDVHLHPKWQRRVASDLKRTFPAIQFVCTSHSPQIIGELKPDEIRILDHGKVYVPPRSFGIDSSRILEELMASPSRDESVSQKLSRLFHLIDLEDFPNANAALAEVEAELGPDDPEIIRARSLIAFLQSTI